MLNIKKVDETNKKFNFGILGLEETATREEVTNAYQNLIQQSNFDQERVNSDEVFKQITTSYNELLDFFNTTTPVNYGATSSTTPPSNSDHPIYEPLEFTGHVENETERLIEIEIDRLEEERRREKQERKERRRQERLRQAEIIEECQRVERARREYFERTRDRRSIFYRCFEAVYVCAVCIGLSITNCCRCNRFLD